MARRVKVASKAEETRKLRERKAAAQPEKEKVIPSQQSKDAASQVAVDSKPVSDVQNTESASTESRNPSERRRYGFEECLGIVKLLMEGKTLPDIAGIVGRPKLSMNYKFNTSNRGLKKARTYQDVCKHFKVTENDEKCAELAEKWLTEMEENQAKK